MMFSFANHIPYFIKSYGFSVLIESNHSKKTPLHKFNLFFTSLCTSPKISFYLLNGGQPPWLVITVLSLTLNKAVQLAWPNVFLFILELLQFRMLFLNTDLLTVTCKPQITCLTPGEHCSVTTILWILIAGTGITWMFSLFILYGVVLSITEAFAIIPVASLFSKLTSEENQG